ncbi:CAP domain-containing protein [Strongyloides ratti]|uniref:CAP domain-containing protein n=1 Tax=Strongyloides ratti TaxID=34506 RepID=A0A090LUM8_STRRB|nr:CAP domain-containing protein [Strongyloides ratti]CEF71329.1 CAP domain-containing protein [Strongyloides ratti]
MNIILNVWFVTIFLSQIIFSRRHIFNVTKVENGQDSIYELDGKKFNTIKEVIKEVQNKNPNLKFLYQDINYYRQKHGVPKLKSNPTIQKFAKKHARKMASQDMCKDDTDKTYGESITYSDGSVENTVKNWYNEINKYDYNKPEFSTETRDFTALIWKSTTEVGCAVTKSKKTKRTYICCKYNKPGNINGLFKENVLPPKQ